MKKNIIRLITMTMVYTLTMVVTSSCDNDNSNVEPVADSPKPGTHFLFTYRFDENLFTYTDSVFVYYLNEMKEEATDTLTQKNVLEADVSIATEIGGNKEFEVKKGNLVWQKYLYYNEFNIRQYIRMECNRQADYTLSYIPRIHVLTINKDGAEIDSYKKQAGINLITSVTIGIPDRRTSLIDPLSLYIDENGKIQKEE